MTQVCIWKETSVGKYTLQEIWTSDEKQTHINPTLPFIRIYVKAEHAYQFRVTNHGHTLLIRMENEDYTDVDGNLIGSVEICPGHSYITTNQITRLCSML